MTLTAQSLIQEFLKRPVVEHQPIHIAAEPSMLTARGLLASSSMHIKDQERLLEVINAHSMQFLNRIEPLQNKTQAGIIEKCLAPSGSHLFVCADLHGDLISLLAQVQALQAHGYLDTSYKCRKNFYMIFLGDYVDRGINDIEVLTLLLTLRMENPSSIFLIRGNHEEIKTNLHYNVEPEFFHTHSKPISSCYQSFPLSVCVGTQEYIDKETNPRKQFIYFCHALFSPAITLADFLQDDTQTIRLLPSYAPFKHPPYPMTKQALTAYMRLKSEFQANTLACNVTHCTWSDIDETPHTSSRGAGYVFSPEQVRLYFQSNTNSKVSIEALFRGHQHKFLEWSLPNDQEENHVRVTTLAPSSLKSKMPGMQSHQHIQGLLLTIQPAVKNWTKQATILMKAEPTASSFIILPTKRNMLEKLFG